MMNKDVYINRNVPVGFVRLTRNWYSRLCCMVRWNGITGAAFPVLCCVRPSSGWYFVSILFAIYVDSLISDLRQSGYCLYIVTLFVGCVVYAEDIVLLSVSCFGLQRLVDICGNYGTQWDIKFNSTKSQVIYFGLATKVLCGISLNGSIIESVDRVKYLNETLDIVIFPSRLLNFSVSLTILWLFWVSTQMR